MARDDRDRPPLALAAVRLSARSHASSVVIPGQDRYTAWSWGRASSYGSHPPKASARPTNCACSTARRLPPTTRSTAWCYRRRANRARLAHQLDIESRFSQERDAITSRGAGLSTTVTHESERSRRRLHVCSLPVVVAARSLPTQRQNREFPVAAAEWPVSCVGTPLISLPSHVLWNG
jgi:hypothetical protein